MASTLKDYLYIFVKVYLYYYAFLRLQPSAGRELYNKILSVLRIQVSKTNYFVLVMFMNKKSYSIFNKMKPNFKLPSVILFAEVGL